MQAVTNQVQSPVPNQQSGNSSTSQQTSGGDFQTFLTLLTAQMRNQDPLKPLDSTAFVAQLASFSAVEQQVQTNTYLKDLLTAYSGDKKYGLSELLGKEVQHSGLSHYSGTTKNLAISIAPVSDAAFLVVNNEEGIEVARQQIPLDTQSILWPPQSLNIPFGNYKFDVESQLAGDTIAVSPTLSFDIVDEIQVGKSGTDLTLVGGIRIPSDSIRSIRINES